MRTPRLFQDIDENELRRKISQEPYKVLWSRLVERWRELSSRTEVLNGKFIQANLAWPGCTPRIIDAALIYRLTAERSAFDYVLSMIKRLLDRYKNVSSPEELGNLGKGKENAENRAFVLSHSEIALAADIVRDHLPTTMRDCLCQTMRDCIIGFTSFEHTLGGYSCGNISCCQNINAGIAALCWGEECNYRNWQDVVWKAGENIRQYLRHSCDEAGFCYEGTGYGHSVFLYIYEYAQLLRQNGIRDLFDEEPLLEKIPDSSRHMLLDDHSFMATTNDHGILEPWTMPWLLLTARYYKRPDHLGLWYAFCGPDHEIRPYGDIWPWWREQSAANNSMTSQEKPDISLVATVLWWDAEVPREPLEQGKQPTAQCAYGTGTATFRSSWRAGSVFTAFLGGGRSHTCHGHAHRDCGHFSLSAYGDYLAIDTGRYNFYEDQHNVVMIDGHDIYHENEGIGMSCDIRSGRLQDFERHPLVDYCLADAAHMKNCRWADRHLLFIKCGPEDAYLILLDNILPDILEPHSYWWQMQVNPAAEIEIISSAEAAVIGKNARLDLNFFIKDEPPEPGIDQRLELRQDIQEWVWPYGREQDTSLFQNSNILVSSLHRPRLLAIYRGVSCCLGTVLSPRRKGEKQRTVQQFETGNLIRLEIGDEQYRDSILIALDHAYIDTTNYYGLCELAVIRRDHDDKIIDIWAKGGADLQIR